MARTDQDTKKGEFNITGAVQDQAHKIGERIGDISEDMAHKMESVAHDINVKAEDYIESSRHYVKDHPLQSVAIAAATGLALGSLLVMVKKNKPQDFARQNR
jgi:ElaB/YqjD/DUF883 family membrane-anchored ribosome-binding protein